ncbi:hypothetical protein [Bacillus sp. S0628]|uniref:hypothetical protein n=1 Tax=Bacillus sp. S0628 TaxID=2957802 RepID=UPI00209E3873|nr:hypothetical protein [Bacillus sp. S0628]MCP1324341.1 hypothetical protein [Bacillus sp. S0628]
MSTKVENVKELFFVFLEKESLVGSQVKVFEGEDVTFNEIQRIGGSLWDTYGDSDRYQCFTYDEEKQDMRKVFETNRIIITVEEK